MTKKTSVKVYKWILWMALHLTDTCYETRNQVMRLLMFTTLFIEGNIIKAKQRIVSKLCSLLQILQAYAKYIVTKLWIRILWKWAKGREIVLTSAHC